MSQRRLQTGRRARAYDPRFPHLSALMAGCRLGLAPDSNYLSAMPADLGMMLNNSLSDCTIAGIGHAVQVWTFASRGLGGMVTQPDPIIERLYSVLDGYIPGDPSTDTGGIEQHVLRTWLTQGIMLDDGINKLAGAIEFDPRNKNDAMWAIAECGVAYLGLRLPQWLVDMLDSGNDPPAVWDIKDGVLSDEGHCVIAGAAFRASGASIISWGRKYVMTWPLFTACVDESYALIDDDWLDLTGRTPLGLTEQQIAQLMAAIGKPLAAA